MRAIIAVCFILAPASALPTDSQRVISGSLATIEQYPSTVSLLMGFDGSHFLPTCGGGIINTRSVITAASCISDSPDKLRGRVGSSYSTSGGQVVIFRTSVHLLEYNPITLENDIAILQTENYDGITFVPNAAQPGLFAGPNYIVPASTPVWVAGWGRTETDYYSEQLRHRHMLTLSQQACQLRYRNHFDFSTFNVFCTGNVLDFPRPDQCSGDAGSPVYHNNVIVGITVRPGCGNLFEPTINTRISDYIDFIAKYA